ncbi:hypothetical protein Salat_1359500 [Sesamum alatum]|uniref:Uncharacterized protein n=1 Tax=Sesamum alatum TaxID=300844 RepID=A0AAE1YJB6_9LAMI|nr:hypothetical protein Salat_1359500 [Sesamum alatum]
MNEGNASEGFSKSRSVLGDLTNQLRARRYSEREKNGIKSFNFNGEDTAKRIRGENQVSLCSCTEVNFLKGNVVLSISKTPNENRDLSVPDLSSGFEMDSADAHCLKGPKVHGGNEDIKILDLDGGTDIGSVEGDALPSMDKIASGNHKGLKFIDLERGRAVNYVAGEADGRCSKSDLLEKNESPGIAEVVPEKKFATLPHAIRGNAVDLAINSGGEHKLDCSNLSKGNNVLNSVNIEANDEVGDSFSADTSSTVSETGGYCLRDGKDFNAEESKASLEYAQTSINDYQNDGDGHNANDMVLSQCGSIDCTVLPESQESRVFGADGSRELKKGNECTYVSVGTSSSRVCSCSFCTKAAYIWLDLNYQDIKARISAMKKSRKEASILAQRSIRSKVSEKNGGESFTRVSKLESHLMYQWSSLFHHMSGIWEEESHQLEARLLPLTDLREKCKTDLKLINATPSETH